MCDSSYDDDLMERYRRNNVELAVALNGLKADLNIVQMELVQRNRELQQAHSENATLKQNIIQKDNQLSTWRLLIMDLVQSNTKKYSEVMTKIGLVTASTSANKSNEIQSVKTVEKTLQTTQTVTATKPIDQNSSANIVQRRQKENGYDFASELSNLTEESMTSQLNESKSLGGSPEENVNHHVVSRRRASVPPETPSTPPSALRQISERMVSNGETNGKKPTSKVKRMDQIIDENTPINGSATGRPTRKTAPRNLSEPKLSTKLRRN